jgi:hypothetical protein
VPDYQALDKWLDQVYMGCFLLVALRWSRVERSLAVALYAWRLVGFLAFELAGARALLFLFPNLFEPWFLAVALVHRLRPGMAWTPRRLVAVVAAITAIKLAQEWALHVGRIFDGFSSLDFLAGLWRWLAGQ